jgi:ribosomal protein S6--L-glutamate ligase
MDIGILTVKDLSYHPNRRLKEAALKQGFSLELIDPRLAAPVIKDSRLFVKQDECILTPGVIIPRQGSQISDSSLAVLSHFQALGIPMVNNAGAILAAKNKFVSLRILAAAGINVPATVFVCSRKSFLSAVETLGGYPVVCKKPTGRKGREVFLVKNLSEAATILETHLVPAEGLLVQQFIEPDNRKDYRILVIGGKVAAAMEMKPLEGDFRSNYSLTGKSKGVTLSPEVENMAVKCAQAVGLEIAGVDLIVSDESGAFVIETNYAPGFKGLEEASGLDIAGMIISHAACFRKPNDR